VTSRPSWTRLNDDVVSCRKCPRLVQWREDVARTKIRRFQDQQYWGRPVAGFGDHHARLLLVGLAPAAHGANRTGRMFTGDRSGDWLYEALHRFGFANMAASTQRDDGLALSGCFITAACRCAPPANTPTPEELDNCRPYLHLELDLLHNVRVIVGLGKTGFDSALRVLADRGIAIPRPRPAFTHGLEVHFPAGLRLLASYHPSQQNTFTGTLTRTMFHSVFRRARALIDHP